MQNLPYKIELDMRGRIGMTPTSNRHGMYQLTNATEICFEIISPSNRSDKMEEKIILYLVKGAREVWLCDEKGNVSFADTTGKLKKSKMVSRFPSQI
ncbi:MAG: Uma2 family endonuclease [Chloroflexi bacterium]|nr:Uma2 family endonuclease [Chloroflexota bacterium]